jgi:hypothetical protein
MYLNISSMSDFNGTRTHGRVLFWNYKMKVMYKLSAYMTSVSFPVSVPYRPLMHVGNPRLVPLESYFKPVTSCLLDTFYC